MAQKSTIYKVTLSIADMDRNYYHDHALTVARHPSETEERLMVRLLAFARHGHERLAFAQGRLGGDIQAVFPDADFHEAIGDVAMFQVAALKEFIE